LKLKIIIPSLFLKWSPNYQNILMKTKNTLKKCINLPWSLMNFVLGMKPLNWLYWIPKENGLSLPWGIILVGILIVDPNVAKFAPVVKLDPRELRYALR
jgi:hypothetical protein